MRLRWLDAIDIRIPHYERALTASPQCVAIPVELASLRRLYGSCASMFCVMLAKGCRSSGIPPVR